MPFRIASNVAVASQRGKRRDPHTKRVSGNSTEVRPPPASWPTQYDDYLPKASCPYSQPGLYLAICKIRPRAEYDAALWHRWRMRFSLIDRILELEPGKKICAVKNVALSEDYLADHFPRFPVLPGVLMIEALTQSSAWLIRQSEDFAHAIVMLKEARNVRYADFVRPGRTLTVTAEVVKQDERFTTLKAGGRVEGHGGVSARLVMERFNLADDDPQNAACDAYTRRKMRELFDLLYDPLPEPVAG